MLIVGVALATAPSGDQGHLAAVALVGAAAGLAATSVGVYGGVLVPGLLVLGVPAGVAAVLSLTIQPLVIPLGAASHAAVGHVRRSITVPLVVGGVVGSVTGAGFATVLPADLVTRAVALAIVIVGVVVLLSLRISGSRTTVSDPPASRIGSIGLVAGFSSGVSGAGWGPIGVKLLILSRIEPRIAIGSSLVGRIPIALAAVLTYAITSIGGDRFSIDLRMLATLVASSGGAMLPGTLIVGRVDRAKLSAGIAVLSIALALPSVFGAG
ncbi:MAG: sulfite exporter TauE/SafE family protein [Chloroflexi bacterium]|nr:sulfite exporter TauE/SafE family protein [Chloroflexota bacterium]